MTSAQANINEVRESLSGLWAPAKKQSVCDWVEKNVDIPVGELTGLVQLRYTPYAREILERMYDKTARHVVFVKGTQLAGTSILMWGELYGIAKAPEDALWVMGNSDQARDFNKERFMPYVHLCPPALDQVPRTAKGVIDKNLWGFKNQHYRNMVLNFVGAGSSANLSSRPRGRIIMDETDKYYSEIGFDAGTIELAEERQKTFSFPISIKASSPTRPNRMIWSEYLKTDQRQYFIPCPRCEKPIVLGFRIKGTKFGDCGVRWWHEHESEAKTDGEWDITKVRANAFYKCQECGGMIHNHEREDMIQEGVWRPRNPRLPDSPPAGTGRYGYQLNSLYSILGNETSLASIASKFLLAGSSAKELQNFVNGWLAEPWEDHMAVDQKDVKLEVISREDIPEKNSEPMMAIDVQAKGYWALVRRFQRAEKDAPFGHSWLLYADFVDTEDDLRIIQQEYGVEGENVVVDMARKPNQVGRIILENDWRGIWGSDTRKFYHPQPNGTRLERIYSVVQFRDPYLGTQWQDRTMDRVRYVLFSKHGVNDMVAALRYHEPSIWHCSVNVHPKYSEHMNSRAKVKQVNQRTGRTEWIWKELHQRNHLYDCENMVTIRALQKGLIMIPNETEIPQIR
jgi:hypothetical protein